jgi:hypothetical protein
MKKIFTILAVSIAMFSTASAQNGRGGQNNNGYDKGNDIAVNDRYKKGHNGFDGHYSFNKKEMEWEISKINREYDYKIQSVKSRMFMNRYRKEKMICALEDQRKFEIKKVYAKFNDHKNRFDDNSRRNW